MPVIEHMNTIKESEYMSGEQLWKYLHISKRKMKYLLENGYIPCTDTGKRTYRYQVKISDAEDFKRKLENDPAILVETQGLFSSKKNSTPKTQKIIITPTVENSKKLQNYLSKLWKNEPDALPERRAAKLVGYNQQEINRLCHNGEIFSVKIANKCYCSKESFITYFSSKKMIAQPYRTPEYTAIIQQFNKKII